MGRFCTLFALAFLGCGCAAADACQTDRFNFVWGSDVSSAMHVRSAEACKFGIRVGRGSHMASIAVAQAPQHGTLTSVDTTHWTYHPARGFSGQDMIVVRVSGDSMGRYSHSGDTNITWAVDVAP